MKELKGKCVLTISDKGKSKLCWLYIGDKMYSDQPLLMNHVHNRLVRRLPKDLKDASVEVKFTVLSERKHRYRIDSMVVRTNLKDAWLIDVLETEMKGRYSKEIIEGMIRDWEELYEENYRDHPLDTNAYCYVETYYYDHELGQIL